MTKKRNLYEVQVKTKKFQDLVGITEDINQVLEENKIENGVCILFLPHTTASLTINSYLDIDTSNDLHDEINRIVPTRVDFQHIRDTPTDAAGHIKSSLVGVSSMLIIENGKILLGRSQGIFFWEFDGPRDRVVYLKIIED
jgi:secondary thiamine-phosphate synthase enzyme